MLPSDNDSNPYTIPHAGDKVLVESESTEPQAKRGSRVIAICVLLLLASAINYMDRQTLAVVAPRITKEMALSETQYSHVEAIFGISFAMGGLLFGYLVDRISVRWVYPSGLLCWSLMGFLTGFARNYEELLVCRGLLGFFEAAHWPCGLKTTQALMSAKSRGMGNSVLQSGTSIGAIITPIIMLATLTDAVGSWRFGFQGIAMVGTLWIVAWLSIVREADLSRPASTSQTDDLHRNESRFAWMRDLVTVRFALVALMLMGINSTWQILRAWMPKVLQQGRGYTERESLGFNSYWYAVTEIGCLAAGAIALQLAMRGNSVKWSRITAFGLCSAMCATLVLIPWLAKGPLFLIVLMIAGAGALGLFPMYYSFSQDVSCNHTGKITGVASMLGWGMSSGNQVVFGILADTTKRFDLGMAIAGCLPIIPLLAFVFFWPNDSNSPTEKEPTT